VWSAQAILGAYSRLAPQIIETLNAEPDKFGTDAEQAYIDRVYPHTPSISVDYAIMERADNVYVLPADIGWSDLGTWASLYEVCPKDERGNVLQGDALMPLDVERCMIRGQKGKLTVLKDLSDYIVVDTPDALLIYPKSKEQEIRQVVAEIKARRGGSWL
ncbi:MAG: mannose-1-phosphate guanylyltransferase, partial [Saprospiraceae bacterium]